MRILVVTARFPEPRKRGDQSRAFAFIRFLGARHEVTVLIADEPSSPEAYTALAEACEIVTVPASRPRRALSGMWATLVGQPGQVGWTMPGRAWRRARSLAGNFDVVVVNTVRSLRGRLETPTVVDYVDALSWNMAIRSRGPESLPVRLAARFEARRMQRWEQRASRWAAGAIATSSHVAASLPARPPAVPIPVAWEGEVGDDDRTGRDIDLIFTGDMRYPPNREGSHVLVREILPRVRARLPEVSCWIVGRHAREVGLPGITVASDVPDVTAFLRRARVAISPVRGQGSLYKVLEAAAHGAAVVAPAWALTAYELEAEVGHEPASYAVAVIRLLTDQELRARRVEQGLVAARAHSLNMLGPQYEAVLKAATSRA